MLQSTIAALEQLLEVQEMSVIEQTERLERERQEQVSLLLNSTGEGIYGVDRDGNCNFCNPAGLAILGYKNDKELIGRNMHGLIHHSLSDGRPYPEADCKIYQAFRSGEAVHADDEVMWRADGSQVPAEYTSHPVHRDGGLVGCVVSFLDITERKRSEEILRQSEAMYRGIFDSSNEAILVSCPSEDTFLDVNPSASVMLGFSREELLRTPMSAIHPDDLPELEAFTASVFRHGKGWANELSCVTKTGRRLPTEISAAAINISGKPCIIALIRDISERRNAEQAMRELAVVEERNRLARELHDSIVQSLYTMTLFAEAGIRNASAGDPEKVVQYIERIGETSQQVLKEMRLLVFELRPLALENQGIVGAISQRLDAVERRAGVEAHLLFDEPLALPARLEEELYRVAQEALNNSMKHAAATHLLVRISAHDGSVEIDIEDDGIGFDLGLVNQSGGMGLRNMRERLDKLGGSFTIVSSPGEGTNLHVQAPIREFQPAESAAPA
ncbi:MAG: PAS domain S-box protein [Dehalococcoidia bacterium]